MADPSNSRDDLSPSQQEALDQYMLVTNEDANAAIPLLQRSEWNVQVSDPIHPCHMLSVLTLLLADRDIEVL